MFATIESLFPGWDAGFLLDGALIRNLRVDAVVKELDGALIRNLRMDATVKVLFVRQAHKKTFTAATR